LHHQAATEILSECQGNNLLILNDGRQVTITEEWNRTKFLNQNYNDMSLAIKYCKEIARELKQIAVYRPGTSIAPGDIIDFARNSPFGVPRPIGEFKKVGTLQDFNIKAPTETEKESDSDSYVFASKGSVSVSFEAAAEAGKFGQGKLTIGFSREGSTYLSAIDCRETRIKSVITLEEELKEHRSSIDWKEYFIVVSVTVASKALIMQSNTSSANLEIIGEVKNLTPTTSPLRDLNANIDLKIAKYKEASFIMDWSNNVPVFFKLVRYKKKFLGPWDLSAKRASPIALQLNEKDADDSEYALSEVDVAELFETENEPAM
jgi:hypothetical protein